MSFFGAVLGSWFTRVLFSVVKTSKSSIGDHTIFLDTVIKWILVGVFTFFMVTSSSSK